MPSKIIVTHEAAMKDKYGARWPAIVTATNQLIAADRARGITSTFVALDSAAFRQWRARVGKPQTFKQAIDHVYLPHSRPDYIAIPFEWRKSTTMSLKKLFGASAKARTSPLEGPPWTKKDLAPLWHFINCHGAPVDPRFYEIGRASCR